MPGAYRHASDLPAVIPVFPLDGAIVLPRGQLPLNIFEPRYLNMIDDAMAGDRLIGMVQTRDGMVGEKPQLHAVGCVARLTAFAETPDGRYSITLSGLCRFRVGRELSAPTPYRQVEAKFAPFEHDLEARDDAPGFDRGAFLSVLKRYLDARGLSVDDSAAEQAPLEALTNSLCMALPFGAPEKQMLLEASDLGERLNVLSAILAIDAASSDDDDAPPMH